MNAPRRFLEKIDNSGDCWQWIAATNPQGYGIFQLGGRAQRAHRLALMWHLGLEEIPQHKQVLHHCDNPGCVNPEHLYLGTPKDNGRDKVRRNRSARGEHNGRSKLTDDQVRAIRTIYANKPGRRLRNGELQALADSLGIAATRIPSIAKGKLWRYVP